jgi:ribosomal protein S18 acetylase RimI-like enzyme
LTRTTGIYGDGKLGPNNAILRRLAIRDFRKEDALHVDALALRAFEQYKDAYADWRGFQTKISRMSSLADTGELVVAESSGKVVGAVAYISPGIRKAAIFRPEWAVMRMLVVSPASRGLGIGRTLAEECLRRAHRDAASSIALHTSKLMDTARAMYLRMGFKAVSETTAIHGIEYTVYLKQLCDHPPPTPRG